MSHPAFEITAENHVSHLKLNRPDRLNSLTAGFWREFPAAVSALADDDKTRVLVISSTGKHFCSGMDFSVLTGLEKVKGKGTARGNAAFVRLVMELQETFSCLARAPFPVIAAIQGGCIGAGLDLVTACDLRYATRDAFFTLQEINIGMVADVGVFPRLQHLIPLGIARQMAFTGEALKAERAERLGLVNGVFENHGELVEEVLRVARTIAAKSPLAIAGSKEMLNYGCDHTTADTLSHAATWQAGMMSLNDVKAALGARQQKTQADFPGLADRLKLED